MPIWYCRVCGLDYDESPWGPDGQSPDHRPCDCCGAEFGYDDHTPEAARRYRAAWLANGVSWFYPKVKPVNWQLEEQFRQVPPYYQ